MRIDLAVLGGGAAGMRAARAARDAGLAVALFEKDAPGGGVIHSGLHSMQTLLSMAGQAAAPRHEELAARLAEKMTALSAAVERHHRGSGMDCVRASAALARRSDGGLCVEADGQRFDCKNLLLAVGSVAAVPSLPGVDDALAVGFARTERSLTDAFALPGRVLVCGGGYRALEMAAYVRLCGAETMLAAPGRLLGGRDPDVADLVAERAHELGIGVLTGAALTGLAPGLARLKTSEREGVFECGLVLFGDERWAAVRGLGLQELGVRMAGGAVCADADGRTNIEGVFAAGECAGRADSAADARDEASACLRAVLGLPRKSNRPPQALCLRSVWNVFSMGETEQSATEKGVQFSSVRLPLPCGSRSSGMVKLLADNASGRLIGAHLAGDDAAALADVFFAAMSEGKRVNDIRPETYTLSAEIAAEALFRLRRGKGHV